MTLPVTGGCSCGAIRYECSAEPIMMFRCHCRDCQQISGSAYSAVVYVPATAFKLTKGVISHYGTPSMAGGHNKRGFCADCGSRLTGGEDENGIGITAASLDDPGIFKPQMDIFTDDAQPWDLLDPSVPHFSQYPLV